MMNVSTMTLSIWRRAETPTGPPFILFGPKTIRYRKSRVFAFIEAAESGKRFDRRQGWPSIATQMAAAAEQAPTKPKKRGRPKGVKNKTRSKLKPRKLKGVGRDEVYRTILCHGRPSCLCCSAWPRGQRQSGRAIVRANDATSGRRPQPDLGGRGRRTAEHDHTLCPTVNLPQRRARRAIAFRPCRSRPAY